MHIQFHRTKCRSPAYSYKRPGTNARRATVSRVHSNKAHGLATGAIDLQEPIRIVIRAVVCCWRNDVIDVRVGGVGLAVGISMIGHIQFRAAFVIAGGIAAIVKISRGFIIRNKCETIRAMQNFPRVSAVADVRDGVTCR